MSNQEAAKEKFTQLAEPYAILSDPQKRVIEMGIWVKLGQMGMSMVSPGTNLPGKIQSLT